MKKIISFILILTMAMSVSGIALAVDCDGNSCTHVAAIGSEHFETLEAAIGEANNGDTIDILADEIIFAENAASIIIEKAITIQGKGKADTKLTFNSATSAFVIKSSNVTFKDMTIVQGTKDNSFHISIDKGAWDVPKNQYENINIRNIDFKGSDYSLCLIGENVVVDSCTFTEQDSHNIIIYSIKGDSKITNNVFNASKGNNKSAILYEGGVSTTLSGDDLTAFQGGGTLTISGNTANAKGVFFQFTNWGLIEGMNLNITENKVNAFTNKAIAIYTENPSVASGKEFASVTVSKNVFTNVPADRPILKEYTGTVEITVSANYLGSNSPDTKKLLEGDKVTVTSYYSDENKSSLVYLDGFAPEPVPPASKPSSGSGIKVKYEGGNSFSTSKSAVPTSVEIDGVEVPFTGNGKSFTVGCIDPNAEWVTVRWNSTSVTVNFKPDVNVVCAEVAIPKTGDMPVWAAVAAFFGL